MCCTLEPAELSGTYLYAGEGVFGGRKVHVVAYQNKAESWGPNAMILPFPAAEPMGRENIIDTSRFPFFLTDITEPLRPRTRSFTKGMAAAAGAEVFEVGSYTVVLAHDINAVPDALQLVPSQKRPRITQPFLDVYKIFYPDWPIAICCWNGSIAPEPLLWWYIPSDHDTIFAPALDAHDGHAPDPRVQVRVDHYLCFGSTTGARVQYRGSAIPDEIRGLLPERIRGRRFDKPMINGDFRVNAASLHEGKPAKVLRGTRSVVDKETHDLLF